MNARCVLLSFALLAVLLLHASAVTRYVDLNSPNPTPPYTNWLTAATNIQDAVDSAVAGDSVLVTNGLYQIGSRVSIDGETNRVVVGKPISVVSVNGSLATIINGGGSNRCVYLTNGATLSGFTLTNGTARYTGSGGALYCPTTNSWIYNCTVISNTASSGGGVYSGTLSNCTLLLNRSSFGGGASHATLSDCVINNNFAESWKGGGVDNCQLRNCTLSGNSALGLAQGGGASRSTLTDCTFSNNIADEAGGAAAECVLTNCIIVNNRAVFWNGGGLFSSTAVNCVLRNNEADRGGGAFWGTLINCTVLNNSARTDGGGVYQVTAYNSIIYYNLLSTEAAQSTLVHCCTPEAGGEGNITNEPLVLPDSRLSTNSPCIDVGTNDISLISSFDADGNPRIIGVGVDIGAYEFTQPTFFTAQPQSQTVLRDFPASFSASASGAYPVRYQWKFNGNDMLGQTNPILSIANCQLADAGSYSLSISNSVKQLTSSNAVLKLLGQPLLNFAVSVGCVTNLAVNVVGAPSLFYQWQKDGINLTDGSYFNGTTSSNLQFINPRFIDSGAYGVVISNSYGVSTSIVATVTVVAIRLWGDSQSPVPETATNILAISAGGDYDFGDFNLALRGDGNVVAWGSGFSGSTNVPAAATNVVAIAAGHYHGLALRRDGTVVGWGLNDSGQLPPVDSASNIVAVSAGYYHSTALKADGTLVGWGSVTPPAGVSNVVAMANGFNYTIVLRQDGSVTGWASNPAYYTAVSQSTSATNVVAIAAGMRHSLALLNAHTLFATNGLSNLTAIACGFDHSVGLDASGVVRAWGNNSYGQATVPTNLANVEAISARNFHTMALIHDDRAQTPPEFVQHPLGATVPAGRTMLLYSYASGSSPLHYQWYQDDTVLPGETNAWLAYTSIGTNNAGSYRVAAANGYGSSTSQVASLTVTTGVEISTSATNRAVIQGSNVVFQVAAYGQSPLFFQWLFNGAPLTNDGRVSGVGTPALVVSNLQAGDTGLYSVVVTNPFSSVTSAPATLTVLLPPTITTQPVDQVALVSNNVTFNVTATGTAPLNYRWRRGNLIIAGSPYLGTTNATLVVTNVSTNLSLAGPYSVIITNRAGAVTSSVASFTAFYPALVTTNPISSVVQVGTNISFRAGATGSALGYRWWFNGSPLVDTGRINGSSSNVLAISDVQLTDQGGYKLVATNPVSSSSGLASLTVMTALGPSTRYVDLNSASPAPPFLDWGTAATNIHDAIDAAAAGDLILVTNGVYRTGGKIAFGSLSNRWFVNKAVTIQSVNGPAATSVEGNQPKGNAAMRCVYLTNGAALIGFTLTNGASRTNGDPLKELGGGGVWCESTNAQIINCVFVSNSVAAYGGGVYLGTSSNCLFVGNAGTNGGGAYRANLWNCSFIANGSILGGGASLSSINGCVFSNNVAGYGGGAFSSTLINSILVSNRAGNLGGGAYIGYLTNCLVVNNTSLQIGGGTAFTTNNGCTIVTNSAATGGGGLYGGNTKNSIVYFNSIPVGSTNGPNFTGGSGPFLTYCCTVPLPLETNSTCTTLDPLFVDVAGQNYMLESNSPCINAGFNAAAAAASDLSGASRVVGGTVDMGAFEFQTPASILAFAWAQKFGLSTDGSADFSDDDGDGASNWHEWNAGTIPTNGNSVLRIVSVSPSAPGLSIKWPVARGRTYSVARATNLNDSVSFQFIALNLQPSFLTLTNTFNDTSATNSGPYFYRVGVQ